MTDAYDAILCTFPLFKGYTPHGAERLRQTAEMRTYTDGQVLFTEGDSPDCVLLVLDGQLRVFVERNGAEVPLTDLGAGSIVGELAVLCGIPRSASVRAMQKSTLLCWSAAAFRRLLLTDTFLSERIFASSLRTLIDKERSLIETLTRQQAGGA